MTAIAFERSTPSAVFSPDLCGADEFAVAATIGEPLVVVPSLPRANARPRERWQSAPARGRRRAAPSRGSVLGAASAARRRSPAEHPEVELALGAVDQAVDVVGVGQPDQRRPDHGVDEVRRRDRADATAQIRSIAGNIAAEPSSDPSDTYRVTRITSTNTGAASSTASGWITSIVPTPGPDAAPAPEPDEDRPDRAGHRGQPAQRPRRPPRRRSRSGRRRPAARPSAGRPSTTTAARFRPSARSAFVPPVRPEPTVRGSTPPVSRATSDAHRDRAAQVGADDEREIEQEGRAVHVAPRVQQNRAEWPRVEHRSAPTTGVGRPASRSVAGSARARVPSDAMIHPPSRPLRARRSVAREAH